MENKFTIPNMKKNRQMRRYERRQHLKALKKTNKILNDGINKIYYLGVKEKPTNKIGDTTREVEERNDETVTNAALHITEQFYWEAKKQDGTEFRDYELHKFLENKGYDRELNNNGNKSEWFFSITLEQFEKELEEFVGMKPKLKVVLRTGQSYLISETLKGWDEGYDLTNVAASVRIGKNIYTLTVSNEKDYFPVYIGKNLTSQTSVEDDNNTFGIVSDMKTISIHGIVEDDEKELSDKTKNIIKDLEESIKDTKKIHFTIDEVDDASHTIKSRRVLVSVINHFRNNSEYDVKVTCMSGTRAYRGLKILNDLKVSGEKINEISVTYSEMQILQPDTTCKRNVTCISIYSDEEVGLTNISDSMKSSTGRKSLARTIEKLLEADNDYGYKVDDNFPHWFIKFATIGKGNANKLVNYLNKTHSEIDNQKYFYVNINGDHTNSRKAQEYAKYQIASHPDCIVVFITQGMATTSFNVKPLGNSIVFVDNDLTSDDIQSLSRSATYDKGKDECNFIIVTTTDSLEFKWDDIFEEEVIGCSKEEKELIYKEILKVNSLTHCLVNGDSVQKVKVNSENVGKVLDKKEEYMTTTQSMTSMLMGEDDLSFYDELERSYKDGEFIQSKSRKSKTKKPKSIYPFGSSRKSNENRKLTINQLKKRQKTYRAFIEQCKKVPSVCRMMGITIEEFDNWDELKVPKEFYFGACMEVPIFADRMRTIYNLCENENYLVNEYINKMV